MQRGSSLNQESVEEEVASPPAFLALRTALLAAYQHAYWTENTWVIGPGHPHDTIEFLDHSATAKPSSHKHEGQNTSHRFPDSPRPDGEYLVHTALGLKSLLSTTTSTNTHQKALHKLGDHLQPSQRTVLVNTLITLGPLRVQRLKVVLAPLADERLNILAQALDVAPLARFQKYMEICTLPQVNIKTRKANEGDAWGSVRKQTKLVLELEHGFSDTRFVQQMQDLVPEIFHKIGDTLFRSSFMPGYLFPEQIPNHKGQYVFKGKTFEKPYRMAFLALDRGLLAVYQQTYWTENTWVIGPGYPHATIKFLDNMGDDCMRIKRAYLSLTIEGLPGAADPLPSTIKSANCNGLQPDNIELAGRFSSRCNSIAKEIKNLVCQTLSHDIPRPSRTYLGLHGRIRTGWRLFSMSRMDCNSTPIPIRDSTDVRHLDSGSGSGGGHSCVVQAN
ncbi:hypothetical protein OEA41_006480 [Lepraria neglecta]|uniref:Uncharacterized protein n=1 Tax=Lepraria neglecta TaxID=209136 RepID=A0AAD9Z8Y9_9LECA|nr:hypothetical protein OEA41_006480 [Lepraria neglecta]